MSLLWFRSNRLIIALLVICVAAVAISRLTIQPAFGQTETTFQLDLAALGYDTEVLEGSGGRIRYSFSLPPNWEPQNGASLELNLAYAVTGGTEALPGTLEVILNEEVLHVGSFNAPVITTTKIAIPSEILRLAEDTLINNLNLNLLVPGQCSDGREATLTVQNSSTLTFVYQERPLSLDLALYPSPFYYEKAFETKPITLLLSSQPNHSELEAAAIIAANLGAQSRNKLQLDVILSDTIPATAPQQHLIIIGSSARMPLLAQLELPLPLQKRQLGLYSQMPAQVTSKQPFSYTLIVENTSTMTQTVTIEDRLSPWVKIEDCQKCTQIRPDLLRWEIGTLSAGQTISITVQAHPAEPLTIGETIEHTASLLDSAGHVINVDTLTTTIALQTADETASSTTKKEYFFALDDQGTPENDGIVQLFVSPWIPQYAIIAVTGLNDAAVLRAAKALVAQTRLPGIKGQFALVQAARPITNEMTFQAQNITLSELGYKDAEMVGRSNKMRYNFAAPRGGVLTEDAYLALHLAHGVFLNTISATLEIRLNGLSIYSAEFEEGNSTDSWIEILLPAQRLKPGANRLEINIAADWPACMDAEDRNRYWLTIYADSFFYLPYMLEEEGFTFDLNDYPQLLLTDPGLQDIVFLLPARVTADEAEGLVRISSFLGSNAQSSYLTPQVNLSHQIIPEQWSDYQLILLGQPTRNPYISLVNDELPQPFIPGHNEIRQQVDNIIYRLPPGYDLGYIQLLSVPWNKTRAMLIVTGTTAPGLRWALRAVADNELNRQLSGNLAVLVGEEDIRTTDTRQPTPQTEIDIASALVALMTPEATLTVTPTATTIATSPTPTPASTAAPAPETFSDPPSDDASVVKNAQPIWLMPLLGLSVLVVVTAIGITIWQARS